jgi:hypothetical protein
MFQLRKLYDEALVQERNGQEFRGVPLARFVLAILGLIGLEILLVLWMYELPPRSPYFQGGSGLLAPSILLTHPKGPLCLLLFLVAVAIATVCRDLAHLTGNRPDEAQQKVVEMQQSLSQGYVLAAVAAAMTFLTLTAWGG